MSESEQTPEPEEEEDFIHMDELLAKDDISHLEGLQVITITYDNNSTEPPTLDLGYGCSPWLALSILQSATESVQMALPPLTVTYKDQIICQSVFETWDDEE